ncbi:GNAT family N-acetyltransferase [Acidaminobacter sp. JC074]|uniref:GNAT family N-acetyltransferase n=1 Tax=Acidaminobacter sp. JC074 TaxID=2530199 RepID=UPI001F0FEF31|nr:GNAT family N-acetyltransferase [Acidaminobacter sp. JC074]MCH4890385.1 GNAT family N-acetyltransferase [Acidaminobacter sp. JC074]
MSSIVRLTGNDHEMVSKYIYHNFWGCIEIAKVFDKNGLRNVISDKNAGTFLGFMNDEGLLEGLFVFTNNKRFLLHFKNDDVTKKVDLLKAVKHFKPDFMSGPKGQVEKVWQMFERTVKRYKYSNSMYMVLDKHDLEETPLVREASLMDAKKQIKFLLEIEKSFKRNHMTINQMQKRIEERVHTGEYLVVEDQERLVAQGFVEDKIQAFSQIGGIYTSSDYRKKGYAKMIVSALCAEILSKGNIPILAVMSDNASAISVYESLGFVRTIDFSIIEIEF